MSSLIKSPPCLLWTQPPTSPPWTQKLQRRTHQHNHNPLLSTPELMIHLFKRCPNIQSFKLTGRDGQAAEYYFWRTIAAKGFPGSIKDLNITLESCASLPDSTILPMVLDRCTPRLQRLCLQISSWNARRRNDDIYINTAVSNIAGEPLPALTDLSFFYTAGDHCPPSCFVSWIGVSTSRVCP